ncbi:MAG: glycosyltransferase [Bacteroidales bacterium]|nr:glycosyltransferase [Bacteroidales bacterium]
MTLDIAIITYGPEGIRRLAERDFPVIAGISYVISWQDYREGDVPSALLRDDIKVVRCDAPGLSNNRNRSIESCTSDIILISDDDITHDFNALRQLIEIFERNPELDVATFRSIHPSGVIYPDHSCRLSVPYPKGYSVTSFEIALRRSTAGNLRACPELGLGSPRFHAGEDEMLLLSAINRHLDCRFYPLTICEHPHVSTGCKATLTDGNLLAAGCVIALTYPGSCMLRIPLKAWRVSRRGQASLARALWQITRGAIAAPGVLRRNRDTLW